MKSKVSIGILAIHLFWALSLGVGAYYVEYGIMSLFAAGGIDKVISANVAGGAILFLLFYLLERRLIEEEVTQRMLFIVCTYIMPIMQQAIMIYLVGNSMDGQADQNIARLMFILTFTLMVMALFFRGMLEVVNYYRRNIKVKRPKL